RLRVRPEKLPKHFMQRQGSAYCIEVSIHVPDVNCAVSGDRGSRLNRYYAYGRKLPFYSTACRIDGVERTGGTTDVNNPVARNCRCAKDDLAASHRHFPDQLPADDIKTNNLRGGNREKDLAIGVNGNPLNC